MRQPVQGVVNFQIRCYNQSDRRPCHLDQTAQYPPKIGDQLLRLQTTRETNQNTKYSSQKYPELSWSSYNLLGAAK